jgi:DNA anti-recombination protein RmuC
VNDVTYFQSYVTVPGIKGYTFDKVIILLTNLKLKPMKNTILTLAVAVFMAGTMLTGCQSSAKKVENAEEKVQDAKDKVVEAKQELSQALTDSIQQFKKESEEKISANEKSIAKLKVRIAKEKKETRAKNEKKLAGLEQKNSNMKKRLDDYNYNEGGRSKWASFKSEFSYDMDELGKALKGFTVNHHK